MYLLAINEEKSGTLGVQRVLRDVVDMFSEFSEELCTSDDILVPVVFPV